MTFTPPSKECALCPRLKVFRDTQRAKHPSWHNAPVPSFGSLDARLLIVGLAPGLEGANATGRPFTGDYAGDLLYATLLKFGLAKGTYAEQASDGLTLISTRITNAVRCVPPQNKPETSEIKACRPFLIDEIEAMGQLRVILALGRIAHEQTLTTLAKKPSAYPFAHGGVHRLENITLISSYHCSRYNTNTGRLTTAMFESVFSQIEKIMGTQ
jgi:uracil-DNA glycosylase